MKDTLKLSGDLTFETVQDSFKLLESALNDTHSDQLQLDLHGVSLCDSAGLALLIEAKRLSKIHNKQFNVIGASAKIQSLAQFCGMEVVLDDK